MLTLPMLPSKIHKLTKYFFFEVNSGALNIMLQVTNHIVLFFYMSRIFSENTVSKCLILFNGAKSLVLCFCLFGTQQRVYVIALGFTPQHIPAWSFLHTHKNKQARNPSRPAACVCISTSWLISS